MQDFRKYLLEFNLWEATYNILLTFNILNKFSYVFFHQVLHKQKFLWPENRLFSSILGQSLYNIYVCEHHIWMPFMAILEKQSLQYLTFIYEEKVLNYVLKQDMQRVLFLILKRIFLKLRKWRECLPSSLRNCAHDK